MHSKMEENRDSSRRFIKGCIILYTVRIFSSSELVEPHIIPLKVRLAVALKEDAKGLVKKYRRGWAGAERRWVMRF